jgi:hypothetical protein
MPRRPANVNLTDLRRSIRACQLENVPFRLTLEPNGAAVFEPANVPQAEQNAQKDSELRKVVG